MGCSGLFFPPRLLIALLNPSSKVLPGFETLQLARKGLAIFPELDYAEMRIDNAFRLPTRDFKYF